MIHGVDFMNFSKLPKKDIQTFDLVKLNDTAKSLRKELVNLRMDVYNAGPQARSNARLMRKTLARLLTAANAKANAGKTK
jgi:ribosomal protein L29